MIEFASSQTYTTRSIDPREMGEMGIARHSHNVCVDLVELFNVVTECNDLGRTYKRAGLGD